MKITEKLIEDANNALEAGNAEFISDGQRYRIVSESNIDIEVEPIKAHACYRCQAEAEAQQ